MTSTNPQEDGHGSEAVDERGCYCSLWTDNAEFLEEQDVPRGYCGHCDVCGEPGHTRHHPGAVPYTGTWCDEHYRRLARTHPSSPAGCLLWLVVIAAVAGMVRALVTTFL